MNFCDEIVNKQQNLIFNSKNFFMTFCDKFVNNQQNLKEQKEPSEIYCKKRCSSKFRKINRKAPMPEFLFKESCRPEANFIKKRLWHRCTPVNFAKFLRINFLTEHLWATASKKVSSVQRS